MSSSFTVKTKPDGSTLEQIYQGSAISNLNNDCQFQASDACCGNRSNEKTRFVGVTGKGCFLGWDQALCVKLVEGANNPSNNPDAPCMGFGTATPVDVKWTNEATTCSNCPKGTKSGNNCTQTKDTAVTCTYNISDFLSLGNVLDFQKKQCDGNCLNSTSENKNNWNTIMGQFCPTISTSCPNNPTNPSQTLSKCSWFLSSTADSSLDKEAQQNINAARTACNNWCGAQPSLCDTAKTTFCSSTDPSNIQCACLNPIMSSDPNISGLWNSITNGTSGVPTGGGQGCWWKYCQSGTNSTNYLITNSINKQTQTCPDVCQNIIQFINNNNLDAKFNNVPQAVSCTNTSGDGPISKSNDKTRTFWQKYGFAIIFAVIAFVVLIIIIVAVVFLVNRKPKVKKTTITDKKTNKTISNSSKPLNSVQKNTSKSVKNNSIHKPTTNKVPYTKL